MSEAVAKKLDTADDVIALFRKAAWDVDQKKLGELKLTDKIADLGLDSVAMLEVIGFLEEQLGMHFADDKLARVQTLQDLAALIQTR